MNYIKFVLVLGITVVLMITMVLLWFVVPYVMAGG